MGKWWKKVESWLILMPMHDDIDDNCKICPDFRTLETKLEVDGRYGLF